jgi:ATP-dependent DNA helicase Rep
VAADKLNPAQREAVTYLDGPCLVLAGAGSGKTRVITAKIAHMVRTAHIKPQHIAAITFTNKAAKEMAHRAKALLESIQAPSRGLTISTFHALGMNLLRKEHALAGLKATFTIMDSSDSASLLQDALGDYDRAKIRAAQSQISLWKNALLAPEMALAQAIDDDTSQIALAYATYARQLQAYQAVDFDDLIGLPVKILTENEAARERWQNKLRYILVDEVQDTNATQYALLKHLVGARAMFTAVGDDDQAIYGWRGATVENLGDLERDYPHLKVIKLEQNYRSTNTILTAANTLIANNPKLHIKNLWSEHGVGDPIAVLPAQHEDGEAELVTTKLLAHKFHSQSRFSDYAVLYRSNHQARIIEQKFRAEQIPYVLSGGQSFFERAEIKDVLAYLRLIVNDDDDQAFMRAVNTPRRGVGPALLEILGSYSGMRQCSLMKAAFEHGFAAQVTERQHQPIQEFAKLIQEFQWRGGLKGQDSHSTKPASSAAHSKGEPAGILLHELINRINYEAYINEHFDGKAAQNRWKNVLDFLNWLSTKAENEGKSLAEVAQAVTLLSMMDTEEEDPDAVRLSTLHAAKGLEFRHVYLIGCEEGLLPHHGNNADTASQKNDAASALNAVDSTDSTLNSADDGFDFSTSTNTQTVQRLEEERRLMYVGVTRARNTLTLLYCQRRKKGREWETREPSRFLKELGLMTADNQPPPVVVDTRAHMAALMARLNAKIDESAQTRNHKMLP